MVLNQNGDRGRGHSLALAAATSMAIVTVSCLALPEPPAAATGESPSKAEARCRTDGELQAAEADISEREKRIKEELKTLVTRADLPADHWAREWAGEYYVGDGLGMNVRLLVAPKSGLTYTWHGCLGLYDGNHGDITGPFDSDGDGRADGIQIKWALDSTSRYDFDSPKFYFVRWAGKDGGAGRRYLVPEQQMMDLVNSFNEGGYARDSFYSAPLKFDREKDTHPRAARLPVEGVPQLPAKWAKLIFTKPLEAKVVAVTPATTANVTTGVDVTKGRVTIDKGRADGLYVGLVVWINKAGAGAGTLTIDKLEDNRAEAAFQAFTSAGKTAALPDVGSSIRVAEGADKAASEPAAKPR